MQFVVQDVVQIELIKWSLGFVAQQPIQ